MPPACLMLKETLTFHDHKFIHKTARDNKQELIKYLVNFYDNITELTNRNTNSKILPWI